MRRLTNDTTASVDVDDDDDNDNDMFVLMRFPQYTSWRGLLLEVNSLGINQILRPGQQFGRTPIT